jgi:hypothetical protein
MLMGDIVQSRTHLDEAIALYDPAADRPLAARFGNDPGITSLGLEQGVCGSSAILRPPSQMQTTRSGMPAKSVMLRL